MIQYRQLEYFLVVATELNFHRAAKALNITQPPLSVAIKKLEDEIGTTLFVRSRKTVTLTPAGKSLLKRAPKLINSALDTVDHVRSIGKGQRGSVHIGYNSSVMLIAIVDLVKNFRTQHPEVAIQFTQLSSDRQMAAVENHELDIGFVDIEVFKIGKHIKTLNQTLATSFELVAALPKNHKLSKLNSIRYKDIASDQHIILARHSFPSLHDKIISACQKAGFSPSIDVYAQQLPEALGLVAAGYGVGIAPDCALPGWAHSISFARFERKEVIDIFAITQIDSENSATEKVLQMLPFQHDYSSALCKEH